MSCTLLSLLNCCVHSHAWCVGLSQLHWLIAGFASRCYLVPGKVSEAVLLSEQCRHHGPSRCTHGGWLRSADADQLLVPLLADAWQDFQATIQGMPWYKGEAGMWIGFKAKRVHRPTFRGNPTSPEPTMDIWRPGVGAKEFATLRTTIESFKRMLVAPKFRRVISIQLLEVSSLLPWIERASISLGCAFLRGSPAKKRKVVFLMVFPQPHKQMYTQKRHLESP